MALKASTRKTVGSFVSVFQVRSHRQAISYSNLKCVRWSESVRRRLERHGRRHNVGGIDYQSLAFVAIDIERDLEENNQKPARNNLLKAKKIVGLVTNRQIKILLRKFRGKTL